jgi:hypothetical protein
MKHAGIGRWACAGAIAFVHVIAFAQSAGWKPEFVAPAAADHGTAVAARLVGRGHGLMPRARLYAATVFRSRGADTDAELMARALDWLVGQKVTAIELGFDGSRVQVLQAALLRVEKRGVAVIDAKLRPYALAKDARTAHQPSKETCP